MLHASRVTRSTIGLVFILMVLYLASGCAHLDTARTPDVFKIEFGQIVKVDGFPRLGNRSTTIEWLPGVSEPHIGVRVENLSKHTYSLAYTISRVNDDKQGLTELETDGWWNIGPSSLDTYEAFIFSEKIQYKPGQYQFDVLIDGRTAKIFEFTVVNTVPVTSNSKQ